MDELNLDDIRTKEADSLSDDERGFLKEHKSDLTEDEVTAYKGVVEFDEAKADPEPDPDPEPDTGFKFNTEEEFEERVSGAVEAALKIERETKKEPKKEEWEDRDERFFPEDYKAKDWDTAAKDMYPKFEKRVMDRMGKLSKERQENITRINKEYDNQIVDIRKADKDIPARGTKEGNQFETELAQIGAKFKGVTDMTEAYEIYKVTKTKDTGEVSSKQKTLASKVGKSGGEGKEKLDNYERIASKSLDQLLEEEEEKLSS